MRGHSSFGGEVDLVGATIGSDVDLQTSTFADLLNAATATVRGSLFMNNHAAFAGGVSLLGATISGDLDMESATFAKPLNANRLKVQQSVFLRNHAVFVDDVNFGSALIGSNLELSNSTFGGSFTADSLEVHGSVFMDHAVFAGAVDLTDAKVGWLDLTTSTVCHVDLSDLSGGDKSELQLGGVGWRCGSTTTNAARGKVLAPAPGRWPLDGTGPGAARSAASSPTTPSLVLRNTHIAALQDDPDAWPLVVDLEGFQYDRLGGINGIGNADMRQRTTAEWVDLLGRQQTYSPQPYVQLATVLAAAGRRDTADDILFAGRERERDSILRRPSVGSWPWLRRDLPAWLWLSFLSLTVGYGIGLHAFRVLAWVVGFTAIGAFLLRYAPYAKQKGVWWRIGASLHRLLPIVELNKEFKDFFDNTPPVAPPGAPPLLNGWLMIAFSALALIGWVLGFFLLAAMGGLIQK